jgi:hypothetical protein
MNRRHFLLRSSAGLAAAASSACAFRAVAGDPGVRIADLVKRLHQQRSFAGAILLADWGRSSTKAHSGRPIPIPAAPTRCRPGRAWRPSRNRSPRLPMLAQERLLRYDDPLSKYIPGITDTVGAATLRHLLRTHREAYDDT